MLKVIYRKTLAPIIRFIYNRLFAPILQIQDSPHSIALGLTVGLWIALTPTVGLQMTLCLILCTLLRANILIAVAMCWISNPITFVPMYYGYYRLGLVVTHTSPTPWKEFREMLQNDYVIFTRQGEGDKADLKILAERGNVRIVYGSRRKESLEKLDALCKERGFPNIKGREVPGKFDAVVAQVSIHGGFGLIDWISWQKVEEQQKDLKIVDRVKYKQSFWSQTLTLLALGFKAFAAPMWLGSLIIATVCAIPSYFITFRAIIRFRKKQLLLDSS